MALAGGCQRRHRADGSDEDDGVGEAHVVGWVVCLAAGFAAWNYYGDDGDEAHEPCTMCKKKFLAEVEAENWVILARKDGRDFQV